VFTTHLRKSLRTAMKMMYAKPIQNEAMVTSAVSPPIVPSILSSMLGNSVPMHAATNTMAAIVPMITSATTKVVTTV